MRKPLRIPFLLRRPSLLVRDLVIDRDRPDLAALASEDDAEAFLWKILPHAARTFSACIAFLPSRLALASAVGYLYCRSLDTYEDLLGSHAERQRALKAFANRFEARGGGSLPEPAPSIDASRAHDHRDRTHVILVNRCHLIDQVFSRLDSTLKQMIIDLVKGMSRGMIWSSEIFEKQRGVLADSEQLRRYCGHVLGLPTIFAARMISFYHSHRPNLVPAHEEDALLAGEMVQLANITRDIEKDLRRGVSYHPSLKSDLGRDPGSDPALLERVRRVREEFLLRALRLAPAYSRFVKRLTFSKISFSRASAIMMLLFTDRHYRACARRVGHRAWKGSDSGLIVILRSLPAIFSRRWTGRVLAKTESCFVGFVQDLESMETRTRPSLS